MDTVYYHDETRNQEQFVAQIWAAVLAAPPAQHAAVARLLSPSIAAPAWQYYETRDSRKMEHDTVRRAAARPLTGKAGHPGMAYEVPHNSQEDWRLAKAYFFVRPRLVLAHRSASRRALETRAGTPLFPAVLGSQLAISPTG
jgi:hypothetical protein